MVGDSTGIISSRGNKFWGFNIFKDTFRDDLQDFRQSGIRTIGGDKTAQRTVIRFNGLFQLADGVGREVDRFGGNGIIIAVGRSRFGVERNDVSELVCSGRERTAVLAGVRVSLEKLFHWVVLSGGGERLDEGIKRDGGNGDGLWGGRITGESTDREVIREIVKRIRSSIRYMVSLFYNVRVAAELFHIVQNGEIRSFNSSIFIQTVFFCHVIPCTDGDDITGLRVEIHRAAPFRRSSKVREDSKTGNTREQTGKS